ncbi:hypothetical protein N1851_022320 [Merluccius polli]|uniref:Uncharacterized protein n=1 Tax=Merluccius polli TaxID=89951 RepID=A0AA47NYL3_MERPO|nr:hypothetical protein N1851_022320 [Merluccius polli]
MEKWNGGSIPDKVETVRLKRAVTLEPMQEHLVWGRLWNTTNLSAGSAVLMEPSSLRSTPRSVIVGRTVALLRQDGSLSLKIINPTQKASSVCKEKLVQLIAQYQSIEGAVGSHVLLLPQLPQAAMPEEQSNFEMLPHDHSKILCPRPWEARGRSRRPPSPPNPSKPTQSRSRCTAAEEIRPTGAGADSGGGRRLDDPHDTEPPYHNPPG